MSKLWVWPLVLGFFTLSGLTTGLVSESIGDIWSWLGLLVPVLVSAYFGMKWSSR
jgi:hypothetical protein